MKKLLMSFCLLILASQAFAFDCDYSFSIGNSTIAITDVEQMIQRDIVVNHDEATNGTKCLTYRMYFSNGLANSYQRKAYSLFGRSINYNLHRLINKSGILKDYGDALNSNEYVEGTAPLRRTNYQNNFFVSVPDIEAQNYARSDYYWDVVRVSIYAYVDAKKGYVFEGSTNLTLLFTVTNKVSVSLVDEGGAFDASATAKVLDFGFLTQYQEKGVDLRVVSNSSYQVKASSGNNSVLKHSSQNASISYSLKVNGSAISLSNSASNAVMIGTGNETTSSGDRYNLRFQILSNTNDMPSGLYQDSITITAIAN